MRIGTRAAAGPVLATTLSSVDAVGAVVSSSLSYGRPIAGTASSVVASFTPRMALAAGEAIFLLLPAFSRGADKALTCTMLGGKVTAPCSWHDGDRVLTVRAGAPLLPLEEVTVEIPASAGIKLPYPGIAINDVQLQLGLNSSVNPKP